MTTFLIEHQCPQCGAPAQLAESDRFFRCVFCRSVSYLTTSSFFRYLLPHIAPPDEQLIYLPYWRFKGILFSCLKRQMHHKFIDFSQQAVPSAYFPQSLGFRSQTQTLRFAVANDDAIFIKPLMTTEDLKQSLTNRFSAELPKPVFFQEYIGETINLIYAPYYLKGDAVIDAVIDEPVAGNAGVVADFLNHAESLRWPLTFVPAICPQCGWDLNGQNDALALTCGNCLRVWNAEQGRLKDINVVHLPGREDAVYVPFWRIRALAAPLSLDSYADFLKIANLPKVPQPHYENRPFYFWAPAFKVPPQNHLSLATALTIAQLQGEWQDGCPPGPSHAVNLPLTEAVESLKLNLAGFMRPREHMLKQIHHVNLQPRGYRLIYLPFRKGHHELIHDGIKLAISKNIFSQAKNL